VADPRRRNGEREVALKAPSKRAEKRVARGKNFYIPSRIVPWKRKNSSKGEKSGSRALG